MFTETHKKFSVVEVLCFVYLLTFPSLEFVNLSLITLLVLTGNVVLDLKSERVFHNAMVLLLCRFESLVVIGAADRYILYYICIYNLMYIYICISIDTFIPYTYLLRSLFLSL